MIGLGGRRGGSVDSLLVSDGFVDADPGQSKNWRVLPCGIYRLCMADVQH